MIKSKGFTLIELVVVIVILGILAATAAPKFIDLSKDARVATLEGMRGAMASGAELIHAKALIENKASASNTITIDGATVSIFDGYPIGNWELGIRYIVDLDAVNASGPSDKCTVEWCGRGSQFSIPSGVSTVSPGQIGKVFPKGYSWNDQCGVYYLHYSDGRKPEIGLETNDC